MLTTVYWLIDVHVCSLSAKNRSRSVDQPGPHAIAATTTGNTLYNHLFLVQLLPLQVLPTLATTTAATTATTTTTTTTTTTIPGASSSSSSSSGNSSNSPMTMRQRPQRATLSALRVCRDRSQGVTWGPSLVCCSSRTTHKCATNHSNSQQCPSAYLMCLLGASTSRRR